jgi:acylglycerol lipase
VSRLRTPALVLYGENEQVIPRQPIEKALAALPRTLPDGGHVKVAIY